MVPEDRFRRDKQRSMGFILAHASVSAGLFTHETRALLLQVDSDSHPLGWDLRCDHILAALRLYAIHYQRGDYNCSVTARRPLSPSLRLRAAPYLSLGDLPLHAFPLVLQVGEVLLRVVGPLGGQREQLLTLVQQLLIQLLLRLEGRTQLLQEFIFKTFCITTRAGTVLFLFLVFSRPFFFLRRKRTLKSLKHSLQPCGG